MYNFNIIYRKYGKYDAIVYPVSYLNPLEDIDLISIELKKHLPVGSCILFDLLLSNGDNFNRFAETYYNGNVLNLQEITVTDISINEISELNLYYRGKTKELSQSVLSPKERFRFATIK